MFEVGDLVMINTPDHMAMKDSPALNLKGTIARIKAKRNVGYKNYSYVLEFVEVKAKNPDLFDWNFLGNGGEMALSIISSIATPLFIVASFGFALANQKTALYSFFVFSYYTLSRTIIDSLKKTLSI